MVCYYGEVKTAKKEFDKHKSSVNSLFQSFHICSTH